MSQDWQFETQAVHAGYSPDRSGTSKQAAARMFCGCRWIHGESHCQNMPDFGTMRL